MAKNLRENKLAKIKLFFSGVVAPFIVWCLFAIPKVIILLLKGLKAVFDVTSFLFK
jgi:hypothetical protein